MIKLLNLLIINKHKLNSKYTNILCFFIILQLIMNSLRNVNLNYNKFLLKYLVNVIKLLKSHQYIKCQHYIKTKNCVYFIYN